MIDKCEEVPYCKWLPDMETGSLGICEKWSNKEDVHSTECITQCWPLDRLLHFWPWPAKFLKQVKWQLVTGFSISAQRCKVEADKNLRFCICTKIQFCVCLWLINTKNKEKIICAFITTTCSSHAKFEIQAFRTVYPEKLHGQKVIYPILRLRASVFVQMQFLKRYQLATSFTLLQPAYHVNS